ncbi:hypothetical protein F5Y10DRAFT_284454 [Nemania abortiva]|nr:hypothetical protein F5Y10DRAFT_284454 [Nemania abortiva]
MRKELETSRSPSLAKDHTHLLHDHASSTDHLEARGWDNLGGRDAERFANIPVVLPIFRARVLHNTVRVAFSLDSPPTYSEFAEKIFHAAKGLVLQNFCDEDSDDYLAVIRALGGCLSTPGLVYFVWDFAPPIHFTETGNMEMPRYGISEASRLSPEEFRDYLYAVHAGKISYIIIPVEIEHEQLQHEENNRNGSHGKPPGILPKKESRPPTPLQQSPLYKQAGQAASSREDEVKRGQQELALTGDATYQERRNGCICVKVGTSVDKGNYGKVYRLNKYSKEDKERLQKGRGALVEGHTLSACHDPLPVLNR